MEGTWGRRVFGWIEREKKWTWFRIELVMEPDRFVQNYRLSNDMLARYPQLYGQILDMMVDKLDADIELKGHIKEAKCEEK